MPILIILSLRIFLKPDRVSNKSCITLLLHLEKTIEIARTSAAAAKRT
jgi:hypothetical protein